VLEMFLDAVHKPIGFFRGEQRRHELHHAGVGVELLKGQVVRRAPGAQQEPLGCQAWSHSVRVAGEDYKSVSEVASSTRGR
jgi:hypothetical protein